MNVHAAALAQTHDFDEQTSAFAGDVIGDLSQFPKRLSPKYFYDAAGSELFEQITVLPEYYPTRTELGILRSRGDEIARIIPKGAALVEFGAARNDRNDRVATAAQDAELGAGRIIFRQHGDLLEQFGACGVVEIFRRQTLGKLRQIADHVSGEGRSLLIERIALSQSGGMHIHDTLPNALSGAL